MTYPPRDPYYGHQQDAMLCARFLTHLFNCEPLPSSAPIQLPRLPLFIAYILYRTKLPSCVTFAALCLLNRLKFLFPVARGASGHRIFLSAFMVATKVICEDAYSGKSWCIVAQGIFSLREINQMEREMCNYLDWTLVVDNLTLSKFKESVRKDFCVQKDTYPTYEREMVFNPPSNLLSVNPTSTEIAASNTRAHDSGNVHNDSDSRPIFTTAGTAAPVRPVKKQMQVRPSEW